MDRFANHENTQLPRFYSRFWCPGTEGSTHFLFHGLARITSSFLPFFLFPESLITLPLAGDRGTLVVPAWPSAPFWPLILLRACPPSSPTFLRFPWVLMFSARAIIMVPFSDRLISGQGFFSKNSLLSMVIVPHLPC